MNRIDFGLDERFGSSCGVRLRVLPDFLLDHSLLHESQEERLVEVCNRWVAYVERLLSWGDETLFCLRLDALPRARQVMIHLLARPPSPERRNGLQDDLEFTLRSYGITPAEPDFDKALPLLSDARVAALAIDSEEHDALADDVRRSFDTALAQPPAGAAFVGIVQDVTADLWQDQTSLERLIGNPHLAARRPPPGTKLSGWLPLNWEGPSGPFVLPFRALLAAETRLRVSIYLQRARVSIPERIWLGGLAQMSHGDGAAPDPVRNLAARRAASALRRLMPSAALVAAEVIAFDGDRDAALRAANVLRTAAMESAAQAPDADEAMPGVRVIEAPLSESDARQAHHRLIFPRWMDLADLPDYARRLPYLAHARGAATLFRLPISVQAGVPGIEVAQAAPDFNPGPRTESAGRPAWTYRVRQSGPEIFIGYFESAGMAAIPLNDLTKHALITGFTGSGKTKTVLHLLHQLWLDHHIPFLVIESAKNEYRGLLGMKEFARADPKGNLRIYTAGNENVAPLRINPFELIPGIRIEAHVNRLQTCFEAAFPPVGPLSSILEQSLIEIYRSGGWMMTDVGPPANELRGRRFPTMTAFAAKLGAVGLARGYEGEFKATLQAAIRSRVMPLTRSMHGSKGRMLDTLYTEPRPDVLFGGPVILEMNDLNEQDKALVSLFLLVLLREHREQQQRAGNGGPKLRHVTVIEEAHNVLEDVASTGNQEGGAADTRYKAVQAFCAMLAEIRALGEGIVIADQSPVKLAPDAMRNTNLQLAHQLRDTRDREAIADAMIMTPEQRDYLGRLQPGRAGIFYTGLQKASFVTVPQFDDPKHGGRGRGYRSDVSDDEVASYMHPHTAAVKDFDRPFAGCRDCGVRRTCDYRWAARSLLRDSEVGQRFATLTANAANIEELVARFGPFLSDLIAQIGHPGSADAAWCCMLHLRHYFTTWKPGGPFDKGSRAAFLRKVVPAIAPQARQGDPR